MKKLLPEVCTIQYGFPFDSSKFSDSEGMPLIRIRDVMKGYSETFTTEDYKNEYVVHENDLLVGMDGEFNIAKWGELPALLNQRVCRLIPKDIDKDYLFYFMPVALKRIEEKTSFVTVKHLSAKELNKIEVPILPLEEQRKIATALNKVDMLISLRKQQLTKLDELVKARFVEMFGDFEINPKGFPVYNLCELCDIGSSKRIYQEEQSACGIPFLKVADLNELIDTGKYSCSTFIPFERYEQLLYKELTPKENDVLITSRGTLGKCYIVQSDDKFYFQDGMISWLSNLNPKISSTYISYLFAQPYIQKQIESLQAGSTVAYLSITMLKKLNVILPPKKLQDNFAAFVERVNQQKQTVQQSLEKLELMKKALMQEYFG